MEQKITWLSARELCDAGSVPFTYPIVYRLANNYAMPHWRPANTSKQGILFPKEIVELWINGNEVADTWLMGRLPTDIAPTEAALRVVRQKHEKLLKNNQGADRRIMRELDEAENAAA